MPQQHEFATPAQRAEAWTAHVERTTNDIARYQAKLDQLNAENKPETMEERNTLLDQLIEWKGQLKPAAPDQASGTSVETLKAQIKALADKVASLMTPPTPPAVS